MKHAVLSLLLLSAAGVFAAEEKAAPAGAQEGDMIEQDGNVYEVHDGKLIPFLPEGMEVQKTEETVVVTASHLEKEPLSSSVNTKVISQDEIIERGARNLADILKQESGIQVNSSLGVGQEVYLDGLDGRTVLILVDGRPVSGRVNNRVDLSRLPISPDNVERVEVIRGPMSALYGSDAMGGVINIITKRPRNGIGGDFTLDGVVIPMQVSQLSASGNLHGGKGPLSGRLGFSLMRGYPYDRGRLEPITGVGIKLPDQVADTPARRQSLLNGEAVYQLTPFWMAKAYGSASDLGVETASTRSTTPFRDANQSRQTTGGVTLEGEPWLGHKLALDARADRFHHDFNKLPGPSKPGQEFCDSDDVHLRFLDAPCKLQPQLRTRSFQHNVRLEARYDIPLGIPVDVIDTLSASVGTVLDMDHSTRTDGDGNDTLQGQRMRGVTSMYGEVLYKPLSFISILPGFRADAFAPYAQNTGFGFSLAPKVSGRLELPLGFALRASYGEGFRLPSFQERFLIFDHSELGYIVQGNADLKPEKSRGARAEILWQMPHWRLSAEGFLNLLDNLISETGGTTVNENNVPIYTYGNIARAYTAGVNVAGSLMAFWNLNVDVTYQYLYNAVDASKCPRSNPYFCSARQGATSLPLRSPHALQMKARYTVPRWKTVLFVQGSFLDKRSLGVLSGNVAKEAPAFTTVGVGFRQPIYDHAEVFATLDNLMDVYNATYGPKPGRSVMLSYRSWF